MKIHQKSSCLTGIIALLLLAVLTAGCRERQINDPQAAYTAWAGESPGKDVQVINGQYWESAHWSKEYILFLELRVSGSWRQAFIRQNDLVLQKGRYFPGNAPEWFKQSEKCITWASEDTNVACILEPSTDHLFIYIVQL